MSRGLIIGIVAVGLCLCAVVGVALALAIFSFADIGLPLPGGTELPPVTARPVTPSQTVGAGTEQPPATDPAPGAAEPTAAVAADTLAMLDEIEQQVSELRGLEQAGTFDLGFPTYEEYRQITIENFEEDYTAEEAADDSRLLAALGLLPPGFDLYDLYIDLYSENILGSYDQDTQEMYVLQASGKFGGIERQTYAHEFDHALQDQNFGLAALGLSDEGCEQDSERCSAISALVEGDATLLDAQWLDQYGTDQDYADISEFYQDYSSATYDRAPCYLRDDFYWPYDDGYQFVQAHYDAGGWEAVDEVYANPPVSSEQIMHLEAYRDGDLPELMPRPVLTGTLGAGWRQIDANVMGEWYTRLILLEPFRDEDLGSSNYCEAEKRAANDMASAAAGWGGDTYVAFYNDEAGETALTFMATWDSAAEADEFAVAFTSYSDARFGGSAEARGGGQCWAAGDYGYSCFFHQDTDTLWLIAPDLETIDALQAALPPFGAGS